MPAPHRQSEFIDLDAFCSRTHHDHDGDRVGRISEALPPPFTDAHAPECLGAPSDPIDTG